MRYDQEWPPHFGKGLAGLSHVVKEPEVLPGTDRQPSRCANPRRGGNFMNKRQRKKRQKKIDRNVRIVDTVWKMLFGIPVTPAAASEVVAMMGGRKVRPMRMIGEILRTGKVNECPR